MNPVVAAIADTPLFAGMSGLELNAVSAFLEPRRYAAGAVIFRRGEPGTEMFIVRAGRVASLALDRDGNERQLYEFGPGRFFGEMAIIENEPRSATCVALETTELLVLEGIDFYRLVWEHPMIGSRMLASMAKVMAGWLDEASGFLTDLVRWGETARKRAVTDELSGLFNRRFIEEASRSRFARNSSEPPLCSALMLDLDRFHALNERFGTMAGDSIISTAGAAYSRLIRDGDVAARLAGDEFAFFMPDAGPEEALAAAERIRSETESLYLEFRSGPGATPQRVSLSASIGVASSPFDATDSAGLFAAADKALFSAKEAGRNRVVRFR
ncbi:MAG TPA: GGDEF domain-containing protein [Spirochaetales bacterium]|nr:GGDEF domain-containing protein [Spirochaetales bacterium]HPB64948.1 GGDEF domain-containing protein [Spirochaetales bacterium]HPG86123.1 GGDEF domain-containing protein [Spirochaetales bacterium]